MRLTGFRRVLVPASWIFAVAFFACLGAEARALPEPPPIPDPPTPANSPEAPAPAPIPDPVAPAISPGSPSVGAGAPVPTAPAYTPGRAPAEIPAAAAPARHRLLPRRQAAPGRPRERGRLRAKLRALRHGEN